MSDESLKDKIIINFAQKLASNESKLRNRSVKKLRNWLSSKSKVGGGFSEKELLKLWKGLHYCMWMCDKPLVQQELSESLSKLLHVFGKVDLALNFFSTFLKTQVREWFTTDRLRLDKFMMLIRMFFHEVFVLLQNHEWQTAHIRQLNSILSADILPHQVDEVPDGLKFHIIGIYFGELAKVGSKKLVGSVLLDLLQPFIDVILVTESNSLQRYVVKHVFDEILKQAKKKLLEAQDRAAAMCDEDPMEIEENEKENSRTLQFDCEALGDKLFELASKKSCRVRNRTSVYGLVKRFKKVSEGIVDQSAPDEEEEDQSDAEEQKALNKLVKFEDNIVQKERKRKSDKKKRKKPKGKADTESDQEEPATKKQKVDTQPEKKVKNKFKEGDTSVNKKGVKSKAKKETSGNSLNHQESNQSSTDDFLFEGGFVSDDENESTGEDLNTSTSSQDDQSVPSIKPTKTSKKKGSKSERTILKSSADTDAVFEGGFVSSSDDEEEEQGPSTTTHLTRKSLNKKKQKKGKSSKLESELVEVESSGSVDEQSNKQVSEELLVLSSDSVASEKKKKKKLKSSGELDTPVSGSKVSAARKNQQSNCMNGSLTSESLEESSMGKKSNKKKKSQLMENGEKGKKKRKKMKTNSSQVEEEDDLSDDDVTDMVEENSVEKECGSDEEVEIYIPNKKYQGKYKDWALTQAQITPPNHVSSKTPKGGSAEKKKKKAANKTSTPNTSTQFATFDKLLKTPPAFVRKAVLKSSPPKTDPRHNKIKRGDEENGALSEGKRRVSFGLHKNVMQSTKEYSDALRKTPDVPFNPAMLPETGILKAKNTPKNTPKTSLGGGKKRRPKAADFF